MQLHTSTCVSTYVELLILSENSGERKSPLINYNWEQKYVGIALTSRGCLSCAVCVCVCCVCVCVCVLHVWRLEMM